MIIVFFIRLYLIFLISQKLSQKYLKGKSFYFSLTKFNINYFCLYVVKTFVRVFLFRNKLKNERNFSVF